MTTSPIPRSAEQRVQDLTAGMITRLQRSYLADQSSAVGALARLRRGAGRPVHEVADLWGLVDTGPLHDPDPTGSTQSPGQLDRADNAVHVAVTLWAAHQQSRPVGMHRPGRTAELGAAVRRLMPPGEIAEPIRARLVRVGMAHDLTALAARLRELITLLRRDDIPLDYGLLAAQLFRWQARGGRDTVRRAWGRSFHANPTASANEPADDTTTIEENAAS